MPSWSTKWFAFLVFGFAIYVVARGDGPKWKQIFTTSMGSGSASASTTSATTPINPATNTSLAAGGNALAQSLTGTNQIGNANQTLVNTGQTDIDSGTWDTGISGVESAAGDTGSGVWD
jgi:hypothetical protein